MNKKVYSLLTTLMLSLAVLVGCSNQDVNTDKKTDTATNDAKVEEKVEDTKNESKEDKDKKDDDKKEESKNDSEDEKAEITFWHAMGGGQGEALESLVADFEKEHPNIKVNLQNQGNYGDLNQILVATMQSPSDLPTITQAYPDWMLQFEDANLVTDLTDMVKGEDGIEDYDDILPGVREEIEQDGKIMGLPFNKSTEVLWYNKTLFDELGLEVPKTYDELKEVSKKIYEEKNIPGVGFDSLPNFYATYLHNKGLEMDKDLDITSPESVEAVNYYLDGIKDGYFRIAGTDQYMSGPFANEQVGAYIGSNAGEVYVKDGVEDKFEYAAAPYPAESAVQQGTNIYMFDNADDAQKKAAFEFLKYLTSKEAQIKFALDTGYMPARTSALEDSKYKDSDSSIAPILADATKNLYSRPLAPGSQQAYNDIGSTLEQILSNSDSDVESELKAFETQYKSDFE
ncbi:MULTISPECIES: ABC transporter substrate-binding protein [Anaerococcus]|uniref:ABC transporter substrate-binding protein n=1 Tax=Anaerococcus nagyae TaxID=1755241 RepID=A0A3E2TFZ1_9FIRM|nr:MULTISPECIES: ABC transporter substrate-binding protein [Anaerococcus]MBP2070118.1 multiple sugar transport system substrate-binding protein [Anaerococcus nagyae]MDU2566341.1 ABC transporter substrate-binding protein [Anaerococcus sp.]MDU3211656.1 ABC transporter substrate-binding protein [Anaerococcus sp.]RGB74905.1 ABC transporter substrate-binding protein [Anaerococcus nagyae]